MVDGRIRQHDRVADVFERPADREVARCVGVDTVLAGRVVGTGDGLVTVEAHGLRLAAVDLGLGGDVWVLLRAEDVILERGGAARSSARNHLPGRVTAVTPEGPLVRVALACGDARLSALVTRASRTDLALEEGAEVVAVIKAPVDPPRSAGLKSNGSAEGRCCQSQGQISSVRRPGISLRVHDAEALDERRRPVQLSLEGIDRLPPARWDRRRLRESGERPEGRQAPVNRLFHGGQLHVEDSFVDEVGLHRERPSLLEDRRVDLDRDLDPPRVRPASCGPSVPCRCRNPGRSPLVFD